MLKIFHQKNNYFTFESDNKFFIAKNLIFENSLLMISEHFFVHVNKDFDEKKAKSDSLTDNYICRILNMIKYIIRLIRQLH